MSRKGNTKTVLIIICIISVLCAAALMLTEEKSGFAFSAVSGFYDTDFDLVINKPSDSKVFYTLDGSDVLAEGALSESAILYTGPIHISDASDNPNVYSASSEDNLFLCGADYGWGDNYLCKPAVPDYPVDKCTVLRAVCRYADGTFSEELSASYYVGYKEKSGYDGMMIVSVVTNPEGFFGYENGINVRGKIFEENDFSADWDTFSANYTQRGIEWERPATVEVFDTNRKRVLKQKCGIRVHGSLSRHYPDKSYNLFARKEYDGNNVFKYDFFGDGYAADKLVLYGCGQDVKTLVRDKMVSELTKNSDLSLLSARYIPAVLFIDGEYWGIRYISDKFDENYFDHYFGIDERDITEIKDRRDVEMGVIEPDDERFIETSYCLMGKEAPEISMEMFERNFDRQWFIDYFATELYIARCTDWPMKNIAFFTSRSQGKGYSDGRWRPILFDVYMTSMQRDLVDQDSIQRTREWHPLFDYLYDDEQFREDFSDRLEYIEEEVFDEDIVDEYLDEYCKQMAEPMEKHLKRFYGDRITMDDFYDDIESIREFFDKRELEAD